MEEFFDQEKAKAFVYLLSEGDNKNKAIISDDQVLVIRKNQRQLFSFKSISSLKSEYKKLLFPLILGGIVAPFAFLSYFANFFLPWIHLVGILGGMFLFYTGWLGKSSFTIVFKNGDELNYYLPAISKNLQAFIYFVNTLLVDTRDPGLRDLLFFEIEKENEDILFGNEENIDNQIQFPIVGFTYRQLTDMDKSFYGDKLLAINPTKAGREIKFMYDLRTNQMRPKLEGPVLEEAKVKISGSR